MNIALDVISGVCWSIVYITATVLGFQRKTWYLPQLAICQNFSWELLVVITRLQNGAYDIAFLIQLAWLLLDTGVLLTWLLYDRSSKYAGRKNAALLFGVFVAMYLLTYRAAHWDFAAFLINTIMSAGFILRAQRNAFLADSAVIAVAKLVGTLSATILNGWIWWNPVLLWLGGLCLLADVYYVFLLLKERKGKEYELS